MAMPLNFITFPPANTFHLIKTVAAVDHDHDTQKFSFNPPQRISRSKVKLIFSVGASNCSVYFKFTFHRPHKEIVNKKFSFERMKGRGALLGGW